MMNGFSYSASPPGYFVSVPKVIVDVVPPAIKSCTLTGQMDAHGEVIGSPTLECK